MPAFVGCSYSLLPAGFLPLHTRVKFETANNWLAKCVDLTPVDRTIFRRPCTHCRARLVVHRQVVAGEAYKVETPSRPKKETVRVAVITPT